MLLELALLAVTMSGADAPARAWTVAPAAGRQLQAHRAPARHRESPAAPRLTNSSSTQPRVVSRLPREATVAVVSALPSPRVSDRLADEEPRPPQSLRSNPGSQRDPPLSSPS